MGYKILLIFSIICTLTLILGLDSLDQERLVLLSVTSVVLMNTYQTLVNITLNIYRENPSSW